MDRWTAEIVLGWRSTPRQTRIMDAEQWCRENIRKPWVNEEDRFRFADFNEAMMFRAVWG